MASATVSPHRLTAVMSEVGQIKADLSDAAGRLDVDVEEFLYVLENDTDVMSILDRLEQAVSMKKDYAERAAERVKQLKAQEATGRDLMRRILEALEAKKVERPTYTAALVAAPRSVNVTDPEAIPFNYLTMVPDKKLIGSALKDGKTVPGAVLSNASQTLRITRGKEPKEETPNAE